MEILFCGSGWLSFVDVLRRHLPDHSVNVWDRTTPLTEAVRGANVLFPSNASIDATVIAAARELRLIQQPAAGVENIDLDAARARGIPVCNAPGAGSHAVAELALLLLLSLARRLPEARTLFQVARIGEPIGRELRGMTLGVVGAGHTGAALARLGAAVGMQVTSIGSRRTDAEWDALLSGSDAISLHCPLTDATRGLIDDRAFARMRPGALLVNVARGPVIDRPALDRALAGGRLGGVGLDVYWDEPWDPADPIYSHPRVVATPHIGGTTAEGLVRIATIAAENVTRLDRGDDLIHRVA